MGRGELPTIYKLGDMREIKYWYVTGTYHGSIIEAYTEGEARRIFHGFYNGESITHITWKVY